VIPSLICVDLARSTHSVTFMCRVIFNLGPSPVFFFKKKLVVCIGTIPCVLANNSKAWSVLYRVASHSGGTAASTNGSDEREQARGAGGPLPFLFLFRLVRSILVLPSLFFESEVPKRTSGRGRGQQAAALTLTRSARSTHPHQPPRQAVTLPAPGLARLSSVK
jgi:hypothetical protein